MSGIAINEVYPTDVKCLNKGLSQPSCEIGVPAFYMTGNGDSERLKSLSRVFVLVNSNQYCDSGLSNPEAYALYMIKAV